MWNNKIVSDLTEIKVVVPQGRVLRPILYLLCTNEISKLQETSTAILGQVEMPTETKWNIKLNKLKSAHMNFTNLWEQFKANLITVCV